jgi:hypothetical protein
MKGWKTIVFNVLMIIITALDYSGQLHLDQFLPASYVWLPAVIAATNVWLRAITSTPVFKDQHPAEAAKS